MHYTARILRLLPALAFCVPAAVSAAAEFIVDPKAKQCSDQLGNPYCSIQPAIDNAPEGGVIRIAQGTFDLWGEELRITRSLKLIGSGAGSSIIDGGGQHPGPLLEITAEADDVHVESLTLRNRLRAGGRRMGAGGISHRAGNLTLNGVSLLNLHGGLGGAVHSALEFGTLRISNSLIEGGQAFVGGGVSVQDGASGTVEISHTRIAGNNALFTGGGLFFRDVAEIYLDAVELEGNTCGNRGGALYVFAEAVGMSVNLSGSRITANECRQSGGIDLNGSDIEFSLSRVALVGNRSPGMPDHADCAVEGRPSFLSSGGSVIGKAGNCKLPPGSVDRIGTLDRPQSVDEAKLKDWLSSDRL